MSKFNNYAVELNTICKGYFDEVSTAESSLAAAEIRYNRNKRPVGYVTMEQDINAAKAEFGLKEAKAQVKAAKGVKLDEAKRQIKELRERLASDLDNHYCADPARVDGNALAILESGMLTAGEYKRIFEKYIAEDNTTMARLVGAAADKAAGKLLEIKNPTEKQVNDRVALSLLKQRADTCGARYLLAAFDEIAEMFNVYSRNSATSGRWDEFTAKKIENF